MSKADTPAALGEDQVRGIINRWNGDGYFRIKYLGDKVFIGEIVPHSSYTLELKSHYEDRSVAPVTVAFPGGAVDDRGEPPGPWEIAVRRPKEFEERTETVPVPHTERVGVCPRCTGQGKVDCSTCHGTGRVNCPRCQGKGYRERQETRTERDDHGNPVARITTVQENCNCANGKVTCGSCSGNGRILCPGCAGSGCVKTFDQLTVRFRCDTQREVLDATDVPDHLVGGVSGAVVVDERAPRIEEAPAVDPEVDRRVRALLEKSQAIEERQTRVLLQELHVERVGIHEVRYKYAGQVYRLWICGNEQRVHAPSAPWLRKKLAILLGGAAALVLVLIVVIVLFLAR